MLLSITGLLDRMAFYVLGLANSPGWLQSRVTQDCPLGIEARFSAYTGSKTVLSRIRQCHVRHLGRETLILHVDTATPQI